jgi:hypothetical protein
MRALAFAMLLIGCGASRPPQVPRSDLAQIPEAWRSSWAPGEQAVDDARATEQSAKSVLAEQRQIVRETQADHARVVAALDEVERDLKRARKDKDADALRWLVDRKDELTKSRLELDRAVRVEVAELALVEAIAQVEQVRRELAEARLERIRAQTAADAGRWIDMARFDARVQDREAALEQAEAKLPQLEAQAVLARQR